MVLTAEDINKTSYFQNLIWFQFYVYKSWMTIWIRIVQQTSVLNCFSFWEFTLKGISFSTKYFWGNVLLRGVLHKRCKKAHSIWNDGVYIQCAFAARLKCHVFLTQQASCNSIILYLDIHYIWDGSSFKL